MPFIKTTGAPIDSRETDSIFSHLNKRGIHIESTGEHHPKYNNPSLSKFAKRLACEQLNGGNSFLKYIRSSAIIGKNPICHFNFDGLTGEQIQSVIEIGNLLCSVGLLVNAKEDGRTLTGKFQLTPPSEEFLKGDFLEIACYHIVSELLSNRPDSEVLPNVKIRDSNGKAHEYDLLFRIGKRIFLIEVKSGTFEAFDIFSNRGEAIGIKHDHQILVTNDRSTEEIEIINYFQTLHVCHSNGLSNIVEGLINQHTSR